MTTLTPSSTITIKQVKDLIDISIGEFIAHDQDYCIDEDDFKAIVLGVNSDLDLRDYLLGLPINHDIELVRGWIAFFIGEISEDDDQRVPFHTIFSALSYEMNDLARTSTYLSLGLEKNYPLAQLLNRVYSAGWPAGALATMREDLHPKVVESLLNKGLQSVI
jgi:hypothetical protein